MRQVFVYITILILSSCDGQTKEQTKFPVGKTTFNNKKNDSRINFSDQKYQVNGFSVSDDLTGNLYPSYSYFEKDTGAFSVNFIGKDKQEQSYWNVSNPKGYFSQKGNPYEIANNAEKIKEILESRKEKYYIVASLLDRKFIEKFNSDTEEYEVNKNAIDSVYLYEKNRWVFIKAVKESEVPENSLLFYEKLILNYYKK